MTDIIFEPGTYPTNIVLVGAGGTGAQWARAIARTLWDMRRRGINTPAFSIVDPDIVEEKNVGRQLYTVADIGENKAAVLARRFAYGLGLPVTWHGELFDVSRHTGEVTLICGAVDNHEARREMQRAKYGKYHGCIWIDAGNHETSGQVIIGNNAGDDEITIFTKRPDRADVDGPLSYVESLPTAGMLFPELLEPPEETPDADLSCAELMEAGAQHLLINDLMATVAASYTWKLLHRQDITTFMTYVDVEGPTVRSVPISEQALASYLGVQAEVAG